MWIFVNAPYGYRQREIVQRIQYGNDIYYSDSNISDQNKKSFDRSNQILSQYHKFTQNLIIQTNPLIDYDRRRRGKKKKRTYFLVGGEVVIRYDRPVIDRRDTRAGSSSRGCRTGIVCREYHGALSRI